MTQMPNLETRILETKKETLKLWKQGHKPRPSMYPLYILRKDHIPLLKGYKDVPRTNEAIKLAYITPCNPIIV